MRQETVCALYLFITDINLITFIKIVVASTEDRNISRGF